MIFRYEDPAKPECVMRLGGQSATSKEGLQRVAAPRKFFPSMPSSDIESGCFEPQPSINDFGRALRSRKDPGAPTPADTHGLYSRVLPS